MTTTDDCANARKVYALLCLAHPHKGDDNLEKAVELALMAARGNFQEHKSTLLAIQSTIAGIENGVGAAEGEKLLLQATRAAEQWVSLACSEGELR